MELNDESEVYHLRDAVWKAAGMAPFDGCLCIGCLEKRLGRQLRPTDFVADMARRRPNESSVKLPVRTGSASAFPTPSLICDQCFRCLFAYLT